VVDKFATELFNPRDGVARWFSVLLLSQIQDVAPQRVDEALSQAVRTENTPAILELLDRAQAGQAQQSQS
jgi:hypothetical protein